METRALLGGLLLCDSSKVDCSQADEGRISTNWLNVGGVTMCAELVHLKVLPLGAGRPDEAVDCEGAGLVRTAAQLDSSAADDPRVCRYRYERSSDDAGSGTAVDRYPSRVRRTRRSSTTTVPGRTSSGRP